MPASLPEITIEKGRVLIADDDAACRMMLAGIARDGGYATETASDGFKALAKLTDFRPDVVVGSLRLPAMADLELLRKVRDQLPGTGFIGLATNPSTDEAVRLIRAGGEDYLIKPIDPARFLASVELAVHHVRAVQQQIGVRRPALEHPAFSHVIGEHPSMIALLELVRQIAPSRASVLIEGESGTGKGIVAQAIHRASLRAERPYVQLSCAELTQSLLESEVFGHEKGAFTGALARREGRFMQADGGTLFLDEVSEIPMGTQVKLLRFLQDRSFERVGGNETLRVDVRIIAATNRSLKASVDDGRFRLDLYYRLNVVPMHMPPLRERATDIPLLAGHFLQRLAKENARRVERFSDDALAVLTAYPWPGNVRELENVVERAVVLCGGREIFPRHLPPHIVPAEARGAAPVVPGTTVYELERWAILRTLEACGGSTSRAAAILGISPRKIQYKLHEYAHGVSGDARVSSVPPATDARMGRAEGKEP